MPRCSGPGGLPGQDTPPCPDGKNDDTVVDYFDTFCCPKCVKTRSSRADDQITTRAMGKATTTKTSTTANADDIVMSSGSGVNNVITNGNGSGEGDGESVKNGDGVVIDELMCFLTNKIKLLPPATIIQLCVSTFNEAEIEASKRVFFDLCAGNDNIRYQKRRGERKSALNIEDMIKLLNEKGTDVPTFVALDLSKLPPITFDSLDVSMLLNEMKKTQNDIEMLRETMKSQVHINNDIQKSMENIDTRVATLEKKKVNNVASCSSQPAVTTSKQTEKSENKTVPPAAPSQPAVTTSKQAEKSENKTVPPAAPSQKFGGNYAAAVNNGPGKNDTDTVQEDKWQIVSKKKKPVFALQNAKPNHGVTGSMKGTTLPTIKKRLRLANVFATRFHPEVSESMLKEYINEKLSQDVTVEKVKTKFSTYASFHIKCECADPSVFMNPTVWPENAYVRWWKEHKLPTIGLVGTKEVDTDDEVIMSPVI